jgi:hypothetical protein
MSKPDQNRQRLSEAIAAALADVERLSGPEERYRAATALVDQLAEAIIAAGRLRARAVVELRNVENLSLARLGRRLGLSKARTADIVRDYAQTASVREPHQRTGSRSS